MSLGDYSQVRFELADICARFRGGWRRVYSCVATTPWLYGSIIMAAIYRPSVRSMFSNHILRSFGQFSYAIYMFHVPILCLIKLHEPNWATWQTVFVTLILSCVAAVLSWHLIEAPCIKLKALFPRESPGLDVYGVNQPPENAEQLSIPPAATQFA